MENEERKPIVSNDLTANSTAEEAESTRTPAFAEGTVRTSANTGWERFLTAKFATVEDAENAYKIFLDKGYSEGDLIVSRIDNGNETIVDNFSDLKSDLDDDDIHWDHIGLGVRTSFRENEDKIRGLWDNCNAVWTNN